MNYQGEMEKELLNAIGDRLEELPGFTALSAAARTLPWPLFMVGGAVRDLILKKEVNDLDLTTAGPLDITARQLSSALETRAIPLGRAPKQTLRFALPGLIIDLVPLEGGNIETELARRDLSINAMAVEFRPDRDRIRLIDPWSGLEDLKQKKARFVSEAVVLADPLRLLRLFRFAATLNLTPHPASLALVDKHAALIWKMAGERIREELLKILAAPKSHATMKTMMEQGLLSALIPELRSLQDCIQNAHHHLDVLDHTFQAFSFLEEIMERPEQHFPDFVSEIKTYLAHENRPALLKLAILLHDLGKPATRSEDGAGRVHFYKHEVIGVKTAAQIAGRFRLSRAEETFICFIIRHHLQPFHLFTAQADNKLQPKGIYRFGRSAGPELWGLLLHALADAMATRGPASEIHGGIPSLLAFFKRLILEITQQNQKLPRLVTGTDLMTALGLPSSPLIGRLLLSIEEAQATGQVRNKKEALILTAQLLKE